MPGILEREIERVFRAEYGRAGWIITTARNRAIDRLRREASRADRYAQAARLHARDEPEQPEAAVRDLADKQGPGDLPVGLASRRLAAA